MFTTWPSGKSLLFSFLIFFLIALFLVWSWFSSGLSYGGAEVGIVGYNPSRFFELQKYVWWKDVAPGMLVPQFITGVPFYLILSILAKIFSPMIVQALLYFVLLFLIGYGMYLFSRSILGSEKNKYAITAGIFYLFNSYMMVEVWHRFLFTGFFLAASLPVMAFFWKYWINQGKAIFIAIFLLINLVFSYMFGNLTSAMAIWLILFMLTLAEIFLHWQGIKESIKITWRFALGLVLFILTNLWWIMPVVFVSTSVLPEQHSFEDNISTLVNISKQTILPFTLQFANPFYLFYSHELGLVYSSFFFQLLPWVPAVIIFLGLINGLKDKRIAPFSLFYLISIIIAKGAAPPFGYPYLWGFINVFILGVIRNPFEKLGILLPFFGSILFAFGLETLVLRLSKKLGVFIPKLLVGLVMISILIYAWPMFSSMVFNKPDYPLQVKVPGLYAKADEWLKTQSGQGNILHLPFPAHDVVTYNWDNGYHGVEINEILFTALPSITRNVGINRVDGVLSSLSFIFSKPFSDDKNRILKIIQSLNVQYIVLHKDTNWQDSATYGKDIRLNNPSEIEKTLNSLEFLEKSTGFGDLLIYKVKPQFYQTKIVLLSQVDLVYPGESSVLQDYDLFTSDNQFTPVDNQIYKKSLFNISQMLIFPEKIFNDWEPSNKTIDNLIEQMLNNPNNFSSPFAQLSQQKSYFTSTGELLSETLTSQLIEADNDLLGLLRSKVNSNKISVETLTDYENLIDSFFKGQLTGSSLEQRTKSLLVKIFTLHLYILDNLGDDKTKQIRNKVNSYLIKNNILPFFLLDRNSFEGERNRKVQRFTVPVTGKFELLLTEPDTLSIYPDSLSKLNLALDGRIIPTTIHNEGRVINLGSVELDKGMHEISYEILPSINLVENLDKFVLQGLAEKNADTLKLGASQQSGGAARIEIPNVFGGDSYEVTFDAMIDNPRQFYFQTIEDTQSQDDSYDCSKISCTVVNPVLNLSPNTWQHFSVSIGPFNPATRNASLQILLPLITGGFSSPSTVLIKNLNLNRIMNNEIVLRQLTPKNAVAIGTIDQTSEISPVLYQGKATFNRPGFLFFKESFNPNWVLTLTKDNQSTVVSGHFLGNLYGNTYFINTPGVYSYQLEFKPQKTVYNGIIFSIAGWIVLLAMLIFELIKKSKYD